LNLVLFHPAEIGHPLAPADPRAVHLRDVLKRASGDEFDAGIVNGPRGKGRIKSLTAEALHWEFTATHAPDRADDITLLCGLCRPQTARDILRDATTLGVAALHFVATEKSEPSYAQSTLWRDRSWESHVIAGAAQAFTTQVPTVSSGESLGRAIAGAAPEAMRLALDNYEATAALGAAQSPSDRALVLALGPERGWGPRDRAELRAAGFTLVHVGSRVLRLETAVIAALTLAKAARGTLH
jgi:RsmE family RNA methyltransferase